VQVGDVMTWKLDGMKDLENTIKELGRLPQTPVTKAARAGATIALRAARAKAPEGETKELKKGIILKKERKRVSGKAVFDVMMDPKKNHIFVKYAKDGTRYYYPASMEYGFFAKDGKYIPGYGFLRAAIEDNSAVIEARMIESFVKDMDRALARKLKG
jgi:hypothetical protein